MFRRVRVRLVTFLVLLFLVLYALTSVLIYGLTVQLTIGSVDAVMQDTAQPLIEQVSSSLDKGLFPTQFVTLAHLASMYPKVSAIILRDALGNEIANTNSKITEKFPYLYSTKKNIVTFHDVSTGNSYRVLTVRLINPYQQTQGYLQLALNINHDVSALYRLRQVLWIVAFAGTLLAAIAGLFMSRLSLRPIIHSWTQQQHFVADASHELRTPLAIINLNLEVINSDPERSVADNSEWIDVIQNEVERLQRLTNDLLTLARSDSASVLIQNQKVNILDMISSAIAFFSMAVHSKGIIMYLEHNTHQDLHEDFIVKGDADRLYQLFTILLDNAIKYTPQGEVRIKLEKKRHSVQIIIKDTGIGIDSSQIDHIFDRFFRADEARTRQLGGSGLGLAIAKWIAEAHYGKIQVRSTLGAGSEFTVTLPIDGSKWSSDSMKSKIWTKFESDPRTPTM